MRWCRKCYQDEKAKNVELQKAYDYRLYIDACHAMKLKAKSYKEWIEEKNTIGTEKKINNTKGDR